jgi:FKBP-type peptidyl-prolyl cis-trans isomerase SlyD
MPRGIQEFRMQVAKNVVVIIDYTLKNDAGNVIDSSKSEGREPLPYIHGMGGLIPGLEKALEGKNPGDNVNVSIAPEEAYGLRNEKLVNSVPKSAFGNAAIIVGAQFRTQDKQGHSQVVTVTKIDADTVTIDANHPLAGATLHFDVTIKDVRQATDEELTHGHVHGPGGHHH